MMRIVVSAWVELLQLIKEITMNKMTFIDLAELDAARGGILLYLTTHSFLL